MQILAVAGIVAAFAAACLVIYLVGRSLQAEAAISHFSILTITTRCTATVWPLSNSRSCWPRANHGSRQSIGSLPI